MKPVKLIVFFVAILMILSSIYFFYNNYKIFLWKTDYYIQFAIGFATFFFLWMGGLKRKHFYSTFEHELTHLLVGLLFLKKPAGFSATDRSGGLTTLYGGNFIITLAPYFLPTISFLMLPLYLVIQPNFYPYYFGILGFFTSYHVLSTTQEFRYDQPDIQKAGPIFSTIFLIFANILCYGILLMFLHNRFHGIWFYLKALVLNLTLVHIWISNITT